MQVVVMNLDSCFTCFKKSLDFLKMKKKMLERMLERMMESMMEMMAFFKMKGMLLEMKRMKMLQYLRMNLIMLLKRMKMMKLAFSKMKMESLLLEMERKRRQERMLLRFWKMSLMLLEQMILLLESMMMNLMLLALIQMFYFDCLMIDCCYSSMSQLSHYSLVYHQQSNLSQFHWQKCYYYSTCSKGFPILPTKY